MMTWESIKALQGKELGIQTQYYLHLIRDQGSWGSFSHFNNYSEEKGT